MTDRLQPEEMVSRLLNAEDILLLCHKNPDGDTTGSAAALCHALRGLGKQAAVFCADPIPAMYSYMQIPLYTPDQFTPGCVAAIDVASIQLFGDGARPWSERVDLCIDHHGSNAGYAGETLLD